MGKYLQKLLNLKGYYLSYIKGSYKLIKVHETSKKWRAKRHNISDQKCRKKYCLVIKEVQTKTILKYPFSLRNL